MQGQSSAEADAGEDGRKIKRSTDGFEGESIRGEGEASMEEAILKPHEEEADKDARHGIKRKLSPSPALEDCNLGMAEFADPDTCSTGDEDETRADFARDDTAEAAAGRSRAAIPITLELLSQGGYYDMPMSKVARLLGRTEGSFQRVCRGLGILRWPYRVRKSLQAIMEKTEQYLDDDAQEDGLSKAEVLRVLQGHMDDIKGISGSGMDKATKQYRQYIFKVNHKLSRKAAKLGNPSVADNHKVRGMLRAASKIQKSKQPGESLEADSKEDSEDLCYSQAGQAPQSQQSMLKPKRQALSSAKQSTPEMSAKKGLPKKNGVSNSQLTAFAVVSPEAVSSGSRGANPGNTSGPTRPTPRHFKDLPASLAFEPLGREKAGPLNIVGRMATSAAVQNRLGTGTPDDCRRLCMQDDNELLQLCLEMDAHLEVAQRALAAHYPGALHKHPLLANPSLMYQSFSEAPQAIGMHPYPFPPQLLSPAGHQPAFWPH